MGLDNLGVGFWLHMLNLVVLFLPLQCNVRFVPSLFLEAVQDDILLYFVLSFDNRIIGVWMI